MCCFRHVARDAHSRCGASAHGKYPGQNFEIGQFRFKPAVLADGGPPSSSDTFRRIKKEENLCRGLVPSSLGSIVAILRDLTHIQMSSMRSPKLATLLCLFPAPQHKQCLLPAFRWHF